MTQSDLVVFSHLRWGFVYQRPQHLLSRLAATWRVTFVEEPVHTDGPAFILAEQRTDAVTVLTPHSPVEAHGFDGEQLGVLRPLIHEWFKRARIPHPVVWLYTPMALALSRALDPQCVVYDCMDDLGAFKDAPASMRRMENALMQEAALVLTGGPSLYEARHRLHHNIHCVPSSVDATHFSRHRLDHGGAEALKVRDLTGHIAGPRLGYFGVIDERMDIALVALLADRHPDWQIVMVGPVVKIDPASLPQRPNIHWMGMQGYESLPYFLDSWDVCLMPFALNEATRFISPTKTLEYMAGAKPVVSTAVRDVVAMYSQAVDVACTPLGFVRACERLLAASESAREQHASEMAALVATSSWDRTASRVDALLCDARDLAREASTANEAPIHRFAFSARESAQARA